MLLASMARPVGPDKRGAGAGEGKSLGKVAAEDILVDLVGGGVGDVEIAGGVDGEAGGMGEGDAGSWRGR